MTDLMAPKGNTVARLNYEFKTLLKEGITLSLGFKKELALDSLQHMGIQLDVLSMDPSKDADGYMVIDISGAPQAGVSKADFVAAILELKVAALQLMGQKVVLMAQVDTCTTEAELDALQFGALT